MNSDQYQPLQLKGEIMDLEFTIDTDHRKRRRNRTTQSCLNCHTSKRKCDRKRPCQRCIQLGLTGLCVYEIDDPALRDDPTIDETTRLRNRIAELESLVRELRGKPHPRWADANFRDGDPNEKWHSRATKCLPSSSKHHQPHHPSQLHQRRVGGASSPPISPLGPLGGSPELVEDHSTAPIPISTTGINSMSSLNGRSHGHSSLLTPIKTEAPSDPTQQLYRFSTSPGPGNSASMRSHGFQNSPTHSPYENGTNRSPYQTHSSLNGAGPSSGSAYSDGGSSNGYNDHHYSSSTSRGSPPNHSINNCPCRSSPSLAHTYISLAGQLQNTLHTIRQSHPQGSGYDRCSLYRGIVDLNEVVHGVEEYSPTPHGHSPSSTTSIGNGGSGGSGGGGGGGGGGGYPDSTGTPPDSDIGDALLSPLSAGSGGPGSGGGPGSFHNGHSHNHTESPTGMSPNSLSHVSGVSGVSSVGAMSVAVSPHEQWGTHSMVSSVGGGGYNPYFAMDAHTHTHTHSHPHAHHAHYGHVMSA